MKLKGPVCTCVWRVGASVCLEVEKVARIFNLTALMCVCVCVVYACVSCACVCMRACVSCACVSCVCVCLLSFEKLLKEKTKKAASSDIIIP